MGDGCKGDRATGVSPRELLGVGIFRRRTAHRASAYQRAQCLGQRTGTVLARTTGGATIRYGRCRFDRDVPTGLSESLNIQHFPEIAFAVLKRVFFANSESISHQNPSLPQLVCQKLFQFLVFSRTKKPS